MTLANDEEDLFKKFSHDFLVYITHLEEVFNKIEESEEKIIIQVTIRVFHLYHIPIIPIELVRVHLLR